MKVEISCPVFRCENEKEIFFARLCALPGIKNLEVGAQHLCFQLNPNCAHDLVGEIENLCDAWGVGFRLLDG